MTTLLIDVFLLLLLVITAIGAVAVRSLLAATLLLAIYSLLMALVWVSLQAVDVAFTEAAVGGGISTVLLIATLVFIGRRGGHYRRSVDLRHTRYAAIWRSAGAATSACGTALYCARHGRDARAQLCHRRPR
jgi:energy-converting hydrogenase B subunit D